MSLKSVFSKIDNKTVEYFTTIRPNVSEYGFYQDRIWRVVSTHGIGKHFRITLERPIAKEKKTIKGLQLNELYLVTKPSGHISL
jgi:hypothetical protein